MRSYAGGKCGARARSAPAFGAERVARGSDPAATGARARSAHAVWNIYRYATGILIVLILFRGGMVWWYLQVVLIL